MPVSPHALTLTTRSRRRRLVAVALGLLLAIAFVSGGSAQESAPARPAAPAAVAAELDRLLEAAWKEEGVRPAEPIDPAGFLRRASLDVTGVVPREDVAAAYVRQRGSAEARARVVVALLHDRGYARSMATRWANLLVGRSFLRGRGEPLRGWLERHLRANTSWDVVVRALLTAQGPVDQDGAVAYYLRYPRAPEELAGNAVRVFQGQQIQCAECHDHPYKERWKQADFWQVAAFFARVRPTRSEDEVEGVVESEAGEARIPAAPGTRGPVAAPVYFAGAEPRPGEGEPRRAALARILTAPDNPFFARATVNRVWSFFFGQGLTDPDDLAVPALPEVLDLLAEDFRRSGYDLRRLCAVLLSTRAYRLESAGPDAGRDAQLEHFARARLRPLEVEQLWWSLLRITGAEEQPANPDPEAGADSGAQSFVRQLERPFFRAFQGDESGPPTEIAVTQALHLINGAATNGLLADRGVPLFQRLLAQPNPNDRLRALYLRVLGRPPDRAELRALSPKGLSSAEALVHLQDVCWALLNSSEFLYNH